MRRFGGRKQGVEISLTPMLDVVFILLIFFIVTSNFTREFGIAAARSADPKQPASDSRKAISLTIERDCWVRIGARRVDPDQVGASVKTLLAERPQAPAIVQVEHEALTGCAVEVMDQLRLAGVAEISLRGGGAGR